MDELSFAQLRRANVGRCEAHYHPLAEWSPSDWATAMAGECGEACNLLAARLGIDLGAAVRQKFDAGSAQVGAPVLPCSPK